jgi:hypothetical protein
MTTNFERWASGLSAALYHHVVFLGEGALLRWRAYFKWKVAT